MIITDKLGKKVQLNNRLAIAEVAMGNDFKYIPKLSFATVISINKKSLSIQYENGCIDNDFTSKEFVIIQGEVINMTSFVSVQKQLEEQLYCNGFIN